MIEEKQDRIVLCGANSYEQKYYFNEQFPTFLRTYGRSFRLCVCCIQRMWAEF